MRSSLVRAVAPRGSIRRAFADVATTIYRRRRWTPEGQELERAEAMLMVIDARLPAPDHDSGSLRLSSILRSAQNLGWFIDFYCIEPPPHGMGANLTALGIDRLGPMHALRRALRQAPPEPVVYICQIEQFAVYGHLVKRLRPDAALVFDTVDLHGERLRQQAELTHSRADRRDARRFERLERDSRAVADVVVAVSEVEAAEVRKWPGAAEVVVIPNVHPTREQLGPPFEKRSGALFVASFSHRPNIDALDFIIDEIAPVLMARLPELHISIVGANPPEAAVRRSPASVRFLGWRSDLGSIYDGTRVALAPLRYGAGMKGKVGESLAMRVPMVTTSEGANGFGGEHGRHFLVADDAESFAQAVIDVYTDQRLWQTLSDAGFKLIDRTLSPEVWTGRVSSLLALFAKGGGGR